MQDNINSVEDLLINESFRNYVKGENQFLESIWSQWLEDNPDKNDLFFEAKNILSGVDFHKFESNEDAKERILASINLKTKRWNNRVAIRPKSWQFYRVAAILVFVLGFIWVLENYNSHRLESPLDSPKLIFQNELGKRTTHLLPDGTMVFLNSGSTLEFPRTFGDSNKRLVKIQGEAYFDVVSNPVKPFVVQSGDLEVIVLGTKFNFSSFGSHPTVALEEGKVRFRNSVSEEGIELVPGFFAEFRSASGQFVSSEFDYDRYFGWKDGLMVFKDANFSEVIERLSRWYGVEFSYGKELKISKEWSYNGKFDNETLDNILLSISSVSNNFQYAINGGVVSLYSNEKQ